MIAKNQKVSKDKSYRIYKDWFITGDTYETISKRWNVSTWTVKSHIEKHLKVNI